MVDTHAYTYMYCWPRILVDQATHYASRSTCSLAPLAVQEVIRECEAREVAVVIKELASEKFLSAISGDG